MGGREGGEGGRRGGRGEGGREGKRGGGREVGREGGREGGREERGEERGREGEAGRGRETGLYELIMCMVWYNVQCTCVSASFLGGLASVSLWRAAPFSTFNCTV